MLYKENFDDISGVWLNKFWIYPWTIKNQIIFRNNLFAGLSHFADREVMVQKYEREKSTDARGKHFKKSALYPYCFSSSGSPLGAHNSLG